MYKYYMSLFQLKIKNPPLFYLFIYIEALCIYFF